jgi:hypothetical protein
MNRSAGPQVTVFRNVAIVGELRLGKGRQSDLGMGVDILGITFLVWR